jgi:hypothetical protein
LSLAQANLPPFSSLEGFNSALLPEVPSNCKFSVDFDRFSSGN